MDFPFEKVLTAFLTPTEQNTFDDFFNNRQEVIQKLLSHAKNEQVIFYFDLLEDAVKMSNIDFFEKHGECLSKIPNQKVVEFFNYFNKHFSFKSEVNLMQIPFNTFYQGRISIHPKKPGNLKKKINQAKFLLNNRFKQFIQVLKKKYCKEKNGNQKHSSSLDRHKQAGSNRKSQSKGRAEII